MATLLGATNGVWGIPAQQTGFLLEGATYSYKCQTKHVTNITGDRTGRSDFDEECVIAFNGRIPATSAFSGTISTALTLITTPTDHLIGNMTSGLTIIDTVETTHASDDYRSVSVSATYVPTITT
jgi:hypothetical protein